MLAIVRNLPDVSVVPSFPGDKSLEAGGAAWCPVYICSYYEGHISTETQTALLTILSNLLDAPLVPGISPTETLGGDSGECGGGAP